MTNKKIRRLKSRSQDKITLPSLSSSDNDVILLVREQLETGQVNTVETPKIVIPTELKAKMQVNKMTNATRRIAAHILIIVLGLFSVGEFAYISWTSLSNTKVVAVENLPAEVVAELETARVAGHPPVETITPPPDPFFTEPIDEFVELDPPDEIINSEGAETR